MPAAAALAAPRLESIALKRHDAAVEGLLNRQVTDPSSPWCGGFLDPYLLCHPHSAGALLEHFMAAFLHPGSKFHRSPLLAGRMRLAAAHLNRRQHASGNFDLLITNFNSPPDTAFIMHNVATAGYLAKKHGDKELFGLVEPCLRRAGGALAVGGVHTPNHRWAVSSALAQIHAILPEAAYVRRIDQWLAEGVDIDADGQYDERSTVVYNAVTNRAFVVLAAKLGKWELLEAVRRNLNSMLYLLHPGYEVVTEISRRQDANQRGTMASYWFALRYLAVRDSSGEFAALAEHLAPEAAGLAALMEYPELAQAGPAPAALPEDYEKHFPALGIARIRRGPASTTLQLAGSSRFFTFRYGEAVVNAVRFASAFFGKGQFVPSRGEKTGPGYHLSQTLEGPYYQPLDPPRKVGAGEWTRTRAGRRRSEVCRLEQSATVTEIAGGMRLRIEARGTPNVPVAVEISLREGGKLEGCRPVPDVADAWLLPSGNAVYRLGRDAIEIGPGAAPHQYTEVRGAEARLPGTSVYITGYTPFDHTLTIQRRG